MNLKDCHNFSDFKKLAQKKLPSPIFHYIDGAADDETTYDRNTSAFNDVDLVPNVLRGVEIHTSALRFPLPDNMHERLAGCKVLDIARRAKYLLIRLSNGHELLVHLGMSGRFQVFSPGSEKPPRQKHDHVIFRTRRGCEVRFNDPRRFGFMALLATTEVNNHKFIRDLGPEPLGNSFNGPALAAKLYGRRTSIKSALLNQKIVAGLGNIYVCESLFIAGVSPRRITKNISAIRAERLVSATKEILRDAINAGGSTLRDHVTPTGEMGYFQYNFKVYGREGKLCETCMQPVKRIVQAGRSTFFCTSCQR